MCMEHWMNFVLLTVHLSVILVINQLNAKILEEFKTNLMSLAILFHFLCVQHSSDINISVIRNLRLCC